MWHKRPKYWVHTIESNQIYRVRRVPVTQPPRTGNPTTRAARLAIAIRPAAQPRREVA